MKMVIFLKKLEDSETFVAFLSFNSYFPVPAHGPDLVSGAHLKFI
jgi:hypothetical protein